MYVCRYYVRVSCVMVVDPESHIQFKKKIPGMQFDKGRKLLSVLGRSAAPAALDLISDI